MRARDVERPFYEVVATLSAQFAALPAANIGQGIDAAMRSIAVALPAQRVALHVRSADAACFVEIARFDRDTAGSLCADDPELSATAEAVEGFPLAAYPWLAGQLTKSESVYLQRVEDLPQLAVAERSLFGAERLASLLFIPMVAQGRLLGFLAADAVGSPRNWRKEVRVLARVVLDMVAGAIDRKRNAESRAGIEARLQTTRRLEIVGRLASGIAHDFNNYLTAILGYGELLSQELEEDGRGQDEIREIRHTTERASALVEQILEFSRAGSDGLRGSVPRTLDLNGVVAALAKIIDRVAGKEVGVVYQLGAESAAVRVDPTRVNEVILNLVANARDAMLGRSAVLTIATNAARVGGGDASEGGEKIRLDVGPERQPLDVRSPGGLLPGDYSVLSVLDTGCGMTRATRARLFEPFYTTKREGRGTGIGLSTVAGFVAACGGAIVVESELEEGSAFHLFLPRAHACAAPRAPSSPAPFG